MNRPLREDAQMAKSHSLVPTAAGGEAPSPESHELLVRRWRSLREMLIRQLDMFESGRLTLHSNQADVSSSAVADLKTSILEFDALIAGDARPPDRG